MSQLISDPTFAEANDGRPAPAERPLFEPGRNCWRVEAAQRFKLLVDGEAYFSALRKAIVKARDTVFILGWDIDSRMLLVPGGANDGFPEPLAEFLHAVVAARPHLRIYVLSWDFAMIYAFEREWLPVFKMGWRKHRRFVFRQDARHPVGGSHHQKVVVIDDRVAFVGGLDLTRSRWDTSDHAAKQPLRRDPSGDPYPPFHDVQVMFDGPAAAALGELARTRWQRAFGRAIGRPSQLRLRARENDPWPESCVPDLSDVELAICRTEPEFAGREAVQEVRQMYIDAIGRARRDIFCENQYFTSGIVGAALNARLREDDGPELVILSRKVEGGWLQEATMGVLRARLHRDLMSATRRERYKMYCPHVPGLGEACVNVHSKLMIVDDDIFFVGSANLNNRSMVLDTECNVALDGRHDPRVRAAIAGFRARLLGEHLGTSAEQVARTFAREGGLIATIEALRGADRTLVPHQPTVSADIDALIPDEAIIDPERPIPPNELVAQFIPEDKTRHPSGRFLLLGALALLVAVAAGVWRWTPLNHYLNIEMLAAMSERAADTPFSPLLIIGAYVVAGLVSVPITLLIAATGIAFGAFEGSIYALSGSLASAAVTYGLGRWLGRETVRRLAGPRINGLSERIAQRGIIAVVVMRLLPVAPFTIVNVIAGASQISIRDYLIGTLVGMGPGIIITVAFANQLVNVVRHPTPKAFAILALIGVGLLGLSVLLQRFFKSRDVRHKKAADAAQASTS